MTEEYIQIATDGIKASATWFIMDITHCMSKNAQNVKISYFIEKKPNEMVYNLESVGT